MLSYSNRIIISLLTYLLVGSIPIRSAAQYSPINGSVLNYRLIGFSMTAPPFAHQYSIEIAEGNCSTETDFRSLKPKKYNSTSNRAIIEVPHWGAAYTWRYSYQGPGKAPINSEFYHFNTGTLPAAGTQEIRMRILTSATKYKEAYVFADKNRTLYDLKGNPLWYLPDMPGRISGQQEIRDIKLSRRGTITFVTNNMAYEINYSGEILWEAPNDGKVSRENGEGYHHELTILSNNNYMVLGNEHLPWKWNVKPSGDSNISILPVEEAKNNPGKLISFGTIIEYDTDRNVVWYWKSSDYFKQTGLFQSKTASSLFDSHENAFYFDEKKNNIYVSFKNFSRVIKISYPDGLVRSVYGNKTDSIMPQGSVFCHQHSCKLSSSGYLYLFNNNICHADAIPTVVMMQEPTTANQTLKKVWEYTYPYKGDFASLKKAEGTSGGNVVELPGGEIFVSMCSPFGNMFIVNKEKKILWDAVLEQQLPGEKKWQTQSSYRASIITNRKDFEHLVWNEDLETTNTNNNRKL